MPTGADAVRPDERDGAVRPVSPVELSRRAHRRRRSTRSAVIAVVSTVVLAVLLYVLVIRTPGWAAVQRQFFDPATAVEKLPDVLRGLVVNLRILVFAALGVAAFGTLIAVVRTLRGPVFAPLRLLAAAYTDLFRGIPLIIVLYLVGFGVPGLGIFPRLPYEFWGTIALVLTYSAYVSEVIRAGIEGVHPSQRLAARSLGLSHAQTLRIVVLPQAVRRVTPALMNDLVSMQKDVGLVSILGVIDAVRSAQIETSSAGNFTPYVVAGLLFVLISLPLIRITDRIAARAQRREQAGAVV